MFWLREEKWKSIFHGSLAGRMGFPHSSVGKDSACKAGNHGWIPGLGRSDGEGIGYPHQYSWVSLVAQLIKNPPAMQEAWVQSWIGKISWRRGRLPTPVFWPEEFQGLHSPWSRRELDTTEQLSLSPWQEEQGSGKVILPQGELAKVMLYTEPVLCLPHNTVEKELLPIIKKYFKRKQTPICF